MKWMALCGCLFFGIGFSDPLTLGQAQNLLLQSNPDLLSQRQVQLQAQASLQSAQSALWPSLDATGSYQLLSEKSRIDLVLPPPLHSVDTTLGGYDRQEYGIDLSYPLFTGGARIQKIRAQRTLAAAQNSRLQALQDQMSLRLAALYYAWQNAEAAFQSDDTIVGYHRDYAAHIQTIVRGGSALPSQASDAEAKLLSAQVDAQTAADLRDSLGRETALLLGLPPDTALAFTVQTDTLEAAVTPAAERPDLEFLDQTQEALLHQEKAVDGRYWPTVSGMVGYRYADPGLNMGTDAFMNYGLAGLQLKWNLFDGFNTHAEAVQLQTQRRSTQIERNRQTGFWKAAVISAQASQTRLVQAEQAAQAAENAAQISFQETQAQHQHGTATDLDLLTAQVRETQAALRMRQLQWQRCFAAWQLRYAQGETIRFPGEDHANP